MFRCYTFHGYTKTNQNKCRLTGAFLLNGKRWDEERKGDHFLFL